MAALAKLKPKHMNPDPKPMRYRALRELRDGTMRVEYVEHRVMRYRRSSEGLGEEITEAGESKSIIYYDVQVADVAVR